LRLLPFSFPALHLLFGDGERLADGVVETLAFGNVWDGRSGKLSVEANKVNARFQA
jgi:hypothetical protein